MPNHIRFSDEEAMRLRLRNEQGVFLWSLAQETGASHMAVISAIERVGGIPIKHRQNGAKPSISQSIEEVLAQEYSGGATIQELQEKYSLGKKAVTNALNRQNVQIRPRGHGLALPSTHEVDKIIALYDSGKSCVDISKILGWSPKRVANVLKQSGVQMRGSRAFSKNKTWEPRVRVGPGGYIKIKLHPEDEFYQHATDGDYILEHRYVMMKNLARPLSPSESVHHIDGDKSNNDISNLQLRTRYHGKGQKRVCGDCGSHNILTGEI